ncbi:hypothetical protein IO90_03125 [Chryseobacterium sp. FH1]|nr:hypothetical protein IO90_03125 [Chryseobacterium sp. FH1]
MNDKISFCDEWLNLAKSQPDLNGNPFLRTLKFNLTEIVGKKDWEWKADKAAQILQSMIIRNLL